ncbi:MAG: methyltransferase, TIGR04325 family [Saprospiraceae bacterium]|nr:methyltransferase, TIGR04325 family [Saprospiraceae bacterium]
MLLKFLKSLTTKPKQYFTNWQTAEKACGRYDEEVVLNTFVNAALAVGQGNAIYDRDGRTYRSFSENSHLVAALQHVSNTKGEFKVLDFGGALGNMYRQHRWFLSKYEDFTWCVVDQESFVETGKRLFTSNKLKFEPTIPEAVASYQPNIAIMSNVLQRIEHPFAVLSELAQSGIPYLFIDRTPVITATNHKITRDTFSAINQEGNFPAWHFSEAAFKQAILKNYRILNEFDAESKDDNVRRAGFFCEKI